MRYWVIVVVAFVSCGSGSQSDVSVPDAQSTDVGGKELLIDAADAHLPRDTFVEAVCPITMMKYPRMTLSSTPEPDYVFYGHVRVEGVSAPSTTEPGAIYFVEDDGDHVAMAFKLPTGIELAGLEGLVGTLYAKQVTSMFIAHDQVVVFWDEGGEPRLFFVGAAADHTTSWYDCGGKLPCPSASLINESCIGRQDVCGLREHPSMEISFCSTDCPTTLPVLQQGDTKLLQGATYSAIEAWRYPNPTCLDSPAAWVSALVIKLP